MTVTYTRISKAALKGLRVQAQRGKELAEQGMSVLSTKQRAMVVTRKLADLYPDAIAYIEKMMKQDSPIGHGVRLDLARWIVEMRDGKAPMYHELSGPGGQSLIPIRPLGGYTDADLLALERMLTTFKAWEGKQLPKGEEEG